MFRKSSQTLLGFQFHFSLAIQEEGKMIANLILLIYDFQVRSYFQTVYFKFELMRVERGLRPSILINWSNILMLIATVQTCQIHVAFEKSFLNKTFRLDIAEISNETWTERGSAYLFTNQTNLLCNENCTVQNNEKASQICNIANIGNSTYNISWSNFTNSTQNKRRLRINCSITASKNHYFKPQQYALFLNGTNISQNCNLKFNSIPPNITNSVNVTRNTSYVDEISQFTFNLNFTWLNISVYNSSLYLKINFPSPDQKVNITYVKDKTNQTKDQKWLEVNNISNQSTFSITNQSRPTLNSMYFKIRSKNQKKYDQFNITLDLIHTFNSTNYTIASSSHKFKNCDAYEHSEPLSINSAFNLTNQLVSNNNSLLIKIKKSQLFGFSFNISVNRSNCLPNNYTLCLNLFDKLNLYLGSNLTFQGNGYIAVYNNYSVIYNMTNKKVKSNITMPRVNLSEGINTVYVGGINGTSDIVQLQCQQQINGSSSQVGNKLNFLINVTQISQTQISQAYIKQIKLEIDDLNGNYPSRLGQFQKFKLSVFLSSPLIEGQYAIITVPDQYTINQSSKNDNNSLCFEYKCYSEGKNSSRIRVQGQFICTRLLVVTIKNLTFFSPKSWKNYTPFQVNTYFKNGSKKDTFYSNTKNATFYLNCSNYSSHCRDCDSSGNCLSCYNKNETSNSAGYSYLVGNTCLSQCPSDYYSTKVGDRFQCSKCANGCKNCTNSTYCSKSSSETNSNSEKKSSESNNSTFALPFIITLLLLVVLAGGSKFIFNHTQLSSLFASFFGVIETFSWLYSLFLIYSLAQDADIGKFMLIAALSANFIINLAGFYFFKADLLQDRTFYRHLYGLRSFSGINFYLMATLIALLMVFSNKVVEILFSNFFNLKFFSFKLQNFSQLRRQNYLRYLSLIPSSMSVAAGITSLLSLVSKPLNSQTFLGLLVMCVATSLSFIFGLKITFRNKQDYQIQIKQVVIDINQQISNQPVSDIHQLQQPKKNKQKSPNKSKQPAKSSIINESKKKAKIVENQNLTHQCIKPLNHEEIFCTEDHFQEKDIDEHSNNLNETRVTTKVYVSKPKNNLNVNEALHSLQGQQMPAKLRKIRPNRRESSKTIKQYIGQNKDEDLKQLIQETFSPQQIKILKRTQKINEIYSKVILKGQNQSQANLIIDNTLTLAEKMYMVVKINSKKECQFDRQTQLAIQQLDLSVDLLAYKKMSLEDMLRFFELREKQQREVLQQNKCSNQSTPNIDHMNNQKMANKVIRYSSKKTKKKSKKRRSNFRQGVKMFIEKDQGDISPYVADFYANHQIEAQNSQLQNQDIDERGNIETEHYLSIDHQPLTLMRGKGSNSLENTEVQEIYGQFKNMNNNADNSAISRSQQIEIIQNYTHLNKKIGSSVPIRMKIDPERGIPQSCQLDQDNVDYLQTNRYGTTQMKPFDIQGDEYGNFQDNFVNRKQEEFNDGTPCKPRIQVIESRILCGSQEIINQFRGVHHLSNIMNRYVARQPITIKKKHLPPLKSDKQSRENAQ